MSIEAMKQALEALTYLTKPMAEGWDAETQMHKRDNAITDLRTAIEQAENSNIKQVIHLYDEPPAAPVQEPVDLSQFYCGSARIRDGEYKLMDMRAVDALAADWCPIYAIPEHLIEHLYTTPLAAQRQWVGLTDEEIERIADQAGVHDNRFTFARTLAAKLREKNGGGG